MSIEDRSGTWYANRQRARAIYSQHKIEEQALNQGTANRMNSNGASPGASTVFYAVGTASGTGEELAAVLQANSAVPPAPPTAPTAPISVTAIANGPESLYVSWTATSSPVTLYTIVASPGDITKTSPSNTFLSFGPSDTIVAGTTYTFVVSATNAIGASPPSAPSAPVKAITYADPPTNVNATDGQNGQSTISWTPSSYDGDSPIILYTAYSSSTQDPVIHMASVDGALSSSVVVTGLTNGATYIFYVTATNGLGEGTNQSLSSPQITPLGPPTRPLNVSAFAGSGNANVLWDAPLNNGGVPITLYIITSSPPDFSGFIPPPFPQNLSIIASGLTNGTPYTFTVVATNSKGDSPASAPSLAVTPLGDPDPPTNVTAVPGNASANVSWAAPVNNGGSPITSYTVISAPDGITVTTSQLSATVSGLANGFPYTFTVYATNGIPANSVESVPSSPVTPRTVPSAPRLPVGTPGNAQVQLSWLAPISDGGSPIINYTVTSTPAATGPQSTSDDSTTLLIIGLTNGTPYTFTVYATNAAGNSIQSVLSDAITPTTATVPSPPQNLSVIRDISTGVTGRIRVSWSNPSSDGGSAILSYTVTSDPADLPPQSVPPSNFFVYENNTLIIGTSYTFTVIATNAIGNSSSSTPSASIIPAIAPSVPQNFTVTPRNQGAILTWSPPLSTGGTPISKYTGYYVRSLYDDWNVAGNVFTYVVPQTLTNGTQYFFRLATFNSQDETGAVQLYGSSYIGVSATPGPTVADPPNITSVQAGPGTGEVTITITPNIYDGGGVFQNYLVEDVGATFTATPGSSPAVLAPLSAGTYQFTVKTVTSIGTSAASAPSSSVTVN